MNIQDKYKFLENSFSDVLGGISDLIQKARISKRFHQVSLTEAEKALLLKAKEICEIQINNLWDNKESEEFRAYCMTYFDIATIFDIQLVNENDLLEYLKIIFFGYLGEHNHSVKSYLKSQEKKIKEIIIPEKWDLRLLYLIFEAINLLVVKNDWKDVSAAVEKINRLRLEQKKFEKMYLKDMAEENVSYGSAELISLYHFAKCIDILGTYLLEGRPNDAESQIEYHIRVASEFSELSQNITLFLLLKYFSAFSAKLIRNTIWYTLSGVNHFVSEFNKFISKRDSNGVFELLYPQKYSIIRGELFNPSNRSIVLNLPTSSGKTLVAEYKILQALNEFKQKGGWVAYVVPTKTLINQIFARLSNDIGNIGIKIDKASGALDIDSFEQILVEDKGNSTDFDVLVTTYEKLNLLVRQGLGTTNERPLVLTIVDEAHNIGDKNRGLNLEMLLASIKNDCPENNFVLLTPDIPNSKEIAQWLGEERSKTINIELDWWQPNERLIGVLSTEGKGRNFDIKLTNLKSDRGSFTIGEEIPLVHVDNFEETRSQLNSKIRIAQLTGSYVIKDGFPIVILASEIGETFQIAEYLLNHLKQVPPKDDEVELVKKFVEAELGENFPLVKFLDKRIAIHNSAIPDEIRQLIELLMEKGKLNVLVATTTIAQGINFPISAVIMGSYVYPFQGDMPTRDFWNIAGRVGRVGQETMGWVGIACRNNKDTKDVAEYIQRASEKLISQLEDIVNSAIQDPGLEISVLLDRDERWSSILQYISHLRKQVKDLETFISELEQKLQNTLGYKQISEDKRKFLFKKLEQYANSLSLNDAEESDSTGFSTISVRQMISYLSKFGFSGDNWKKEQLFSVQNETMQKLVGIMLNTYEIRKSLEDIKVKGQVLSENSISRLIIYWVNGYKIADIANKLFPNEEQPKAIELTSKALYKVITTSTSWGISALQKMPTSGINWDNISENEKIGLLNIPAYIYYGVNTDAAVIMRKANVPRSIAKELGEKYEKDFKEDIYKTSTEEVISWLNKQKVEIWNDIVPSNSPLTGEEYLSIWKKLNLIE